MPPKRVKTEPAESQKITIDLCDLQRDEIPEFEPLFVQERRPEVHLPRNVRPDDPVAIFDLYFPEWLLVEITSNTNAYAAANAPSLGEFKQPRQWRPLIVGELRVFIACQLYMGLHPEGLTAAYWNRDTSKGPLHQAITEAIGYTRYCQIERYFHLTPPLSWGETAPPWEKVLFSYKLL